LPDAQETAEERLDTILTDGVALDLFNAKACAAFLEEIDRHVDAINSKKVGKAYFATQQQVLQEHMLLLIWRLFEPYSNKNENRTIPQALHLIRESKSTLPFRNRPAAIEFARNSLPNETIEDSICDSQLREVWLKAASVKLPRPQENAKNELSRALHKIQNIRHQALAHRAEVSRSTLLAPPWLTLQELLETAEDLLTGFERAFLISRHNLKIDLARPLVSLKNLLREAGIIPQ
jgi:anaerobic ribonucleoside-triphosphate reductase